MLDQQKTVIERASDNKELFRKEIVNSFRFLKSYELLQLHFWLKRKYNHQYGDVIRDIFQFIAV